MGNPKLSPFLDYESLANFRMTMEDRAKEVDIEMNGILSELKETIELAVHKANTCYYALKNTKLSSLMETQKNLQEMIHKDYKEACKVVGADEHADEILEYLNEISSDWEGMVSDDYEDIVSTLYDVIDVVASHGGYSEVSDNVSFMDFEPVFEFGVKESE